MKKTNLVLVPFLLSAITILSNIPTPTATTPQFTCIDISKSITSQWPGNVEYKFSIKNLVSTFTNWRVELHFDQPVNRLQQWFGAIDNSIEIVHEKERVFIIKYKSGTGGSKTLSPQSTNKFLSVTASYIGAIEPKVQQAVLCGMTDGVYQKRVHPIEPLPAMFDSNAPTPQCSVKMGNIWTEKVEQVVEQTITFPVIKDIEGWFMELKFNQTWTKIKQWSCNKVSSDGTHFLCQNLKENSRLAAGSSFSIKYHVYFKQQAPWLVDAWFNGYHCSAVSPNQV